MGAPVVHFEIYGKDASKLQQFYKELFDWHVSTDNPMNYGFVSTHAEGDKGIDGGIAGGDSHVEVVIEVDDLQKYLDRAESLGGKTIMPPTEIPGVVKLARFADPEGNLVGLVLAD